jgi:peptidoglycan-N-acetylglucosamine deacetylase
MRRNNLTFVVMIFCFITLVVLGTFLLNAHNKEKHKNIDKQLLNYHGDFHWPTGKKGAISLSFDDARPSQIDKGIAILDRYGVKATFYVSIPNVRDRLAAWKQAAANGHEIGNHSLTHPCTTNYFSYSLVHKDGLEDYTLKMMQGELDEANTAIEHLLGIRPTTFAYPCGQKFVGRGKSVKSYVPLVAERFIVGRGWNEEMPNVPAVCDLSQVMGMSIDNMDFAQAKKLVDNTVVNEQWLILVGHNIGKPGFLSTDSSTLQDILRYAQNPDRGIWIDTVHAVGSYVLQEQIRIEKNKRGKATLR